MVWKFLEKLPEYLEMLNFQYVNHSTVSTCNSGRKNQFMEQKFFRREFLNIWVLLYLARLSSFSKISQNFFIPVQSTGKLCCSVCHWKFLEMQTRMFGWTPTKGYEFSNHGTCKHRVFHIHLNQHYSLYLIFYFIKLLKTSTRRIQGLCKECSYTYD